jgi:hypothetical protein
MAPNFTIESIQCIDVKLALSAPAFLAASISFSDLFLQEKSEPMINIEMKKYFM